MTETVPAVAVRRASLIEELRADFVDVWQRVPAKGLFLGLLAAWLALFHFWGNPALGYFHTQSLFGWLNGVYTTGDGEDGHGKLVPVVVLILFWLKRDQFRGAPTTLWPMGLMILAFAAGLHAFGYFVQQTRISVVALLIGVGALMATVWGPAVVRRSFFPLWLLVFCIPLSVLTSTVSFQLRLLATNVVVFITNTLLGMRVLQEGTSLVSPDQRFNYEVAAACGGMRSLVATFCIATIYAWLALPTFGRRLIMLASAFPLAVAGNVIRLLMVVLASEFVGQEFGLKLHDSSFFSLVPYIPTFIGLFCLGRWLERGKMSGSVAGEGGA